MDDYAKNRSTSSTNNDAVVARQIAQQLKSSTPINQSQPIKLNVTVQNPPASSTTQLPSSASVQQPIQEIVQVEPNSARIDSSQKVTGIPKINNIDGFYTSIQKPVTMPEKTAPKIVASVPVYYPVRAFSFKSFINTLLNTGLYNPGEKALSLALISIKLSVIANLTPRNKLFENQPGSALRAATVELFNLGKFSVEHVEVSDNNIKTNVNNTINDAALSLSSIALSGRDEAPLLKMQSRKFKIGEIVSSITNRAHQKRNHIKAAIAASIACGIIVVSGGFMYANSRNLPEGNISSSIALYVNTPAQQQAPEQPTAPKDENTLKPNHFKISSLGIDAPSITVGLTADNAVDVPQQLSDVAWFNGSALPGKPGVTFMVGHYAAGYGGVFDNLTKIKEGDVIELTDSNNTILKYKVTEKSKQKVADINMDNLLNSSPGENKLVIMTCAGSYIAQNYTDRFIVTATPIN